MNAVSFRKMEVGVLYKVRDPFGAWDGLVAFTLPDLQIRGYVALFRPDTNQFEQSYLTKPERREKIFEPLDKPVKF